MINFRTGEELKTTVENALRNHEYKFRIVDIIAHNLDVRRPVIMITGDRRRGKTTSMYGIIKEIGNYDKCAMITLKRKTTINEFETELKEKLKRIEYLFIDEVTEFDDIEGSMKVLSDEIVGLYCNKVIVTGTWSQALFTLKRDIWLDRVNIFTIDPISPVEYKDKFRVGDINKYLKSGGYFPTVIKDISEEDETTKPWRGSLQESLSGIPLTDMFSQYFNYMMIWKSVDERDKADYFLRYLAAFYSYTNTSIKEVNKVINNSEKIILKLLSEEFSILPRTYDPIKESDIKQVWEVMLASDIAKIILNEADYKDYKLIPTNVLSEFEVRTLLGIGNPINNRGLQLEHYILRYVDTIDTYLKIQDKESNIDFEMDGIDRKNKLLIEIKLGSDVKNSWKKNLMNTEILKQFGLEKYEKVIVYSGENKTVDSAMYMNVYDYLSKYGRHNQLIPWEQGNELTWGNS